MATSSPILIDNPGAAGDIRFTDHFAIFTITLTQAYANDVLINYYTAQGSALAGVNYDGQHEGLSNSGTITIKAGQTTALVSIGLIARPINQGSESFNLVVTTGSIPGFTGSVSGIATIINDEPVVKAIDDNFSADQDKATSFSVFGNDNDTSNNPDKHILTVVGVGTGGEGANKPVPESGKPNTLLTTTNGGIVVIDENGNFTYTPAAKYVGTDSFTYKIMDGVNGLTSSATVNLLVNPGQPVAVSDAATTNQNTSVDINILSNDTDPNGDLVDSNGVPLLGPDGKPLLPLISTGTNGPQHGQVDVDPTSGLVTYTPFPNYAGTDSFTYTIRDQLGHTSTAQVFVNVVNSDTVVAVNDILPSVSQDQAISLDILSNDLHPAGEVITVVGVGGGASDLIKVPQPGEVLFTTLNGGQVILDSNGIGTYTPADGYFGTDSFTYTLMSSFGTISTANVVITLVDGTPVASNDIITTSENQPGSVNVLTNDSDPNGDAKAVTEVGAPGHGTAIFNKDGTVTYTPTIGYVGTDSFTYILSDGKHTTTGLVSVNVTNAAPTGTDDTSTTRVDTPVNIQVTGNDTDPDGNALTISGLTAPKHGTAEIVGTNGFIKYTPASQYSSDTTGPDSFTYTLSDGHGHFATATVTVTVNSTGPNPPALTDDTAATSQDNPVIIDTLANDTDADGDKLTIIGKTNGAHGTVAINADGTLTYTPNAGYVSPLTDPNDPNSALVPDTFTYTVSDGQGHTSVGNVSVTIANGTPTAQDDSANVGENGTVVVNVLANDSDPQNDALTIAAKTDGTHGKVIISGGSVIYTPDKGYFGTDSFTYTISDNPVAGQGHTSTATVGVTITNAAPVAVDDAVTTNINQAAIITVLSNDSDPESDQLAVSMGSTSPAHGKAVVNENGTITYTPDGKFVGDDTFTYVLSDGNNHFVTGNVTVTIENSGPNAPTLVDDSVSTSQDKAVNITVLANDSDAEGDPLTVTSTSRPAHGTVKIETDGTLTYTPNAGYFSAVPDTFTYTVSDGQGHTSVGNVSVTIANGTPTAVNDSAQVDQNGTVNIPVLDNDADPQSDTLTITKAGDGAGATNQGGKVAINGGVITYSPKAGFHGSDSFSYTISDGTHTATATVDVTVNNNAPTATDDTAVTRVDTPVDIQVLLNDSDPEKDTLTVTNFTAPGHGTLKLASGVLTYTPSSQYFSPTGQPDSFAYTISDGQGHFSTATVTVAVNNTGPGAPTAVQDDATTSQDKATTIAALANDSDPENDALTVTGTSTPAHGTVKINDDGTLTYTPAAGYFSATPDSFTYTVSDGQGHSAVGTVNVTIEDGTPVANDVTLDVPQNNTVNVRLGKSASDPQNDPLTFKAGTDPSHGKVDYTDGSDTVTYTPESGFTGQDQFTYVVSDGTHTATATVTVNVVNRAPTAGDDSATTGVDKPVDITVLDNDSDPDSDALTVLAGQITQPLHGTVALNTGVITYTPDKQYVGSDSFEYTISDGKGHTDTATVNISVTNTGPGAPTASPDNVETKQNTAIAIGVLDNDTDPEGDALTVTKITAPGHGAAVIGAGGVVTYTPKTGYFGSDAFSYTVSDGQGHTSVGVVNISVANSGPGAPIATNDSAQTNEDTAVVVKVLANDSDPENDALSLTAVSTPAHGVATIGSGGIVTYQPAAGFVGIDTFTYTVDDGQGHDSQGTVTVTVDSGAPIAFDDSAVTAQNQKVVINLLDNDTDPQGDSMVITAVTDPEHGSVVVGFNGNVTYTPTTGYTGTDGFAYRVSDTNGHSGVAFVDLQVNAPPVVAAAISDQSATTNKFFQFTIPSGTFKDDAGDPLAYSARLADGSALPSWLGFDPAGRRFQGTAGTNDTGTLNIRVTATDALFPTLSVADEFTLTVATVAAVSNPTGGSTNHAPTSADASATVPEGATRSFGSADFAFTDQDAGNSLQAVLIDSLPAEGRLLLSGQAVQAGQSIAVGELGQLTYQAPGVLSGDLAQHFAFKVSDGQSLSASDNQFTLNLAPTTVGTAKSVDDNNQAIGKNGADTLLGDGNDNLLNGKGGGDRLYGGDGADTLKGGAGNDLLSGGGGGDNILGQGGKDTLIGGAGNDTLNGGAGKDVYQYQANQLGADDLIGGFHDVIKATKGDTIDFTDAVWNGLHKGGGVLTGGATLASALGEGTNIAFDGHAIQIDVDGDGQFDAGKDFAIEIVGVHKVGVDASGQFLTLG